MSRSKIEWTDRSDWNPIRGCTRISPGCGGPGDHGGCYAEVMAARFSDPGQWGHGFAERTAKGARWTGKVEIQWDRLELPLRWRTPATIFASSTSDFFHAALLMYDVAQLFGVMIAAHHLRGHIFQVLSKRGDIMRAWLNNPEFWEIANAAAGAYVMERVDPLNRRSDDARATLDDYGPENPPPGIWLGVSVEDQPRADERREDFRATPAAVKFVSYEPALGPVDWTGWDFVQQIIGGGESGPKARPMHPDWQRATRDYCAAHGIAYFFKQWGEWFPYGEIDGDGHQNSRTMGERSGSWHEWKAGKGFSVRIGKKAAGRLLDGRTHEEFPDAHS
ncbi:DUF5131 family protein [Novosphingobium sp.]|uniref:DUF5131 family protein n=1 Tax=Novosphingobium sp. TaxID=1874826 RepID=UPI00352B3521